MEKSGLPSTGLPKLGLPISEFFFFKNRKSFGLPNARDFHRIAKIKFENFDLGISTGLPITKVYSGLPK